MSKLVTKPLFDQRTIQTRICELGTQISNDLAGESVVAIGVLKGAFIFMADLI